MHLESKPKMAAVCVAVAFGCSVGLTGCASTGASHSASSGSQQSPTSSSQGAGAVGSVDSFSSLIGADTFDRLQHELGTLDDSLDQSDSAMDNPQGDS